MRRITFLSVMLGCLVVVPAWAHPPSDIKVTYDPATKTVSAVITHKVKDPAKHFINKVDVGLNGKEILTREMLRQDNKETQSVEFQVPQAKSGDVISVEGYCNIFGKMEKEIKVP